MHPDYPLPRPLIPRPGALAVSRKLLRILIAVNWIFGAAIAALLIWTFAAPDFVTRALGAAGDPPALPAMRTIMALGIAGVPVTYAMLSRLLRMVDTVRAGDPFVVENALRLQHIAWAVLALEVFRLTIGAVARSIATPSRPIDISASFSVTPWLAVLLLFVLARVFDQGARMREELEGTV